MASCKSASPPQEEPASPTQADIGSTIRAIPAKSPFAISSNVQEAPTSSLFAIGSRIKAAPTSNPFAIGSSIQIAPSSNSFAVGADAYSMNAERHTSTSVVKHEQAVRPGIPLKNSAGHTQKSHKSLSLTTVARLQRAASKLAGNATAVDVLTNSLNRLLSNPHDERYRIVNLSSPKFTKIAGAPGAIELLYTSGYQPMHGHLVLQHFDNEVVEQAVAFLEEQRATAAYLDSKEAANVAFAQKESASEAKAAARAKNAFFASKVPPEPPEGEAGSSKICFHLPSGLDNEGIGDEKQTGEPQQRAAQTSSSQSTSTTHVWRRFEAWRTVSDLYNFARSLESMPTESLVLVNATTRPSAVLDESCIGKSLESLDLWPSGHIFITVNA